MDVSSQKYREYYSQIDGIIAYLEHDTGDQSALDRAQVKLDKLAEHYQNDEALGGNRYLLYQAQAMLSYRQNDFGKARRFIEESVNVRGQSYDLAEQMLRHLAGGNTVSGDNSFNLATMNRQRLAIGVAAIIGMLATFMPWAHVAFATAYGSQGDGWITFVLFGIALVMALLGDKVGQLKDAKLYAALAGAGLAVIIGIWKIADFKSKVSDIGSEGGIIGQAVASSVSIGFGLYLVILAGIAVFATAFLVKDGRRLR